MLKALLRSNSPKLAAFGALLMCSVAHSSPRIWETFDHAQIAIFRNHQLQYSLPLKKAEVINKGMALQLMIQGSRRLQSVTIPSGQYDPMGLSDSLNSLDRRYLKINFVTQAKSRQFVPNSCVWSTPEMLQLTCYIPAQELPLAAPSTASVAPAYAPHKPKPQPLPQRSQTAIAPSQFVARTDESTKIPSVIKHENKPSITSQIAELIKTARARVLKKSQSSNEPLAQKTSTSRRPSFKCPSESIADDSADRFQIRMVFDIGSLSQYTLSKVIDQKDLCFVSFSNLDEAVSFMGTIPRSRFNGAIEVCYAFKFGTRILDPHRPCAYSETFPSPVIIGAILSREIPASEHHFTEYVPVCKQGFVDMHTQTNPWIRVCKPEDTEGEPPLASTEPED